VRRAFLLLLWLALPALVPSPARAQVVTEPAPPPWPDPKKFAKGFFASGEIGALVFFGRAGRYSSAGPIFGVRIGYDIFRWLDVQTHITGSSHDAETPPPTFGQSFQTLMYNGEVRLKLQLRRFQIFAEGGAGLGQITSNVLDQVGVTDGNQFTLVVIAGLGLDYHTLNRHFSVGLGADYLFLNDWHQTSSLTAQAYLRYTY
jgi:Outer membrane protein beta-barrel domain